VCPRDHEHVADFELVLLRGELVVETHDLLLDGVNEALWVEHADQLVARVEGVALFHERVELAMALLVLLLPGGD